MTQHLLLNPELTISVGPDTQLALGCSVSVPCAIGFQTGCLSYMAFMWALVIQYPILMPAESSSQPCPKSSTFREKMEEGSHHLWEQHLSQEMEEDRS